MVATGLICAFFIIRADLARRRVSADAEAIIGVTGLAGLAGSRLYHLLETPATFFADPWPQLFSTMGFAWFGAVIGGFVALLWLAHRFRIRWLLMLDIASPAAALGYGIGRIGCLLSGDGDYGKPTSWAWPWGMSFPHGTYPTTVSCVEQGWPSNCRVYPTPIYEFLIALVIFWVGVARFLIEFIRINPRHQAFFGLTNAQAASLVSILAGALLLAWVRHRSPVGQPA